MRYAEIDQDGNFIGDVVTDTAPSPTMIATPVPPGILAPRWDGGAWTDVATPELVAAVEEARQLAAAQATDRLAAVEAVALAALPVPVEGAEPTFAELTGSQVGAIFPGQRFVWTDGNVWECVVGPLNSNATPETWPQGYSQITGLPPDVAPWVTGEAVIIGDLREFEGIVYRCIQAHTTQAGWTPPAVPALWTPQG